MHNDDNGITDDDKTPGDVVRYGCVFCATGRESELVRLLTPRYPELRLISPVKQRIRRMGGEALCLTGGLCEFPAVREGLEKAFGRAVLTSPDARYAGAVGAALYAAEMP